MVEYKTLRNCVEQLKEAKVDKGNRRKIISKISSQSDLEVEISRLQLKEAGNHIKEAGDYILVAGVAGLYTSLGLHLADNSSNEIVKYIVNFLTVLPAVILIDGVILAADDICGAVKNCYNSYTNKPDLIR